MITRRIFLASSFELKEERQQFEILINRKNKQWIDQGVFLELVVWEDFLDAVSKTRLQDEYNEAIRQCDIFVMLFSTKMGPYTQEEFETAFQQFKTMSKPLIFVYLKDAKISMSAVNKKDLMSVLAFQDKLDAMGHFYTLYESIDGLKLHFTQQLEKLAAEGFFTGGLDQNDAGSASPAARQGTVDIRGSNRGTINTGWQQIDTGGGALTAGEVHVTNGNFIGRDWNQQGAAPTNLESSFAPLVAAVATSGEPADVRAAALHQVDALKAEVSKGHRADDNRMSRIVNDLADKIPGAIAAVVSVFAAPPVGGVAGTLTSDAVDKLRSR